MTTTLTVSPTTDTFSLNDPESLFDDESIRTAFMYGDCWVLARYLSHITDLKIAVSACAELPDMWNHMGVMVDENTVLDINGLSTTERIAEKYNCNCGNTLCDGVVTRKVSIDDWEYLTSLIDGMAFCVDAYNGDYVYDDNEDMVAVEDIAYTLMETYL